MKMMDFCTYLLKYIGQGSRQLSLLFTSLPTVHPLTLTGNQLLFNRTSSTSNEAFTALAADAKELRTRKVQSVRDKRRHGATITVFSSRGHVEVFRSSNHVMSHYIVS